MKQEYNITAMEQYLFEAMDGIGEKTYAGTRASKESEHFASFVVVAFPNRVVDNLGNGNTMCRIDLYAKDLQNGVKNSQSLGQMQSEVYDRLPLTSEHYLISNPQVIQRGRDTLGFHCVSIICNVLIY